MAEKSLQPRQLYIVRHAERVDFTFGAWIPRCFDDDNKYTRFNLNMPKTVPYRTGGPWDFFKDCPLTMIGLYQATLTGQAVKDCGVKFSHVFCSPSLRCIETCTNILKASDQTHLVINVEPGLFEWLAWYHDGMPAWMALEEFCKHGYNVSLDYEPVLARRDLFNTRESSEEYYMRSFLVSKKILSKYNSGNVLFVGHAATLDTCSRQLVNQPPRSGHDLQNLVYRIPYCSVAVAEEDCYKNTWNLVAPPFPALMHSNNMSFDWKVLQS